MLLNELYGIIPIPDSVSKRKIAKIETDRLWHDIAISLINQALNIFEWKGLPETCNERYLEMNLLLRGQACIVDDDGAFLSLGCSSGGDINLYREPTSIYAYGANGYNKKFKLYIDGADETGIVTEGPGLTAEGRSYSAVICRDNKMMYPYINYIFDYAKRLVDVQRACDVMIQNLKQPVIIQCGDDQVDAVKRALNQRDDNVGAIVSTGRTMEALNSFHVWPTGVDAGNLVEMRNYYEWLYSQVQEELGIATNPQPDKAERLLVDEVNSNNQEVETLLESRLEQRKLFAERVNKAFGLNVSVDAKIKQSYNDNESEVTKDESADT